MGSVELDLDQTANSLEKMDISEQQDEITLESLPTEILLHILQFLDVRFIVEVLSCVSSKFLSISRNETTWKLRLSGRWPGQYPAVPADIDWTKACIAREEEETLWRAHSITATVCSNAHYSSVDCVKIIGDLVVSGSRDRGINIWNIDDVVQGITRPRVKLPDAHKGWVWSFTSSDSSPVLVSGSWDNTVKFWQIGTSSLQETRKPINLKVAVLSTDMRDHTVVAGTFDKVQSGGYQDHDHQVFVTESHSDGRPRAGQEVDILPEPLQASVGSQGDGQAGVVPLRGPDPGGLRQAGRQEVQEDLHPW